MHTDFNQIKVIDNKNEQPSNVSENDNKDTNESNETKEIVLVKTSQSNDEKFCDLESISNDLYENIVEHLCLGIYFDIYKSYKLNSIKIREYSNLNDDISESKIYENPKLDIFGHSLNGLKKLECACPNCSRTCAASRLAPHLEKCLGMGRNSSRLASKRIALAIKNSNGTNSE